MPSSKAITLFDENMKALVLAGKNGDPRAVSRVLGLTAFLRRNLSAQQLLSLAGLLLPGASTEEKKFFSKVLDNQGKWGVALEDEPATVSAISAKDVVDSAAARVYLHVLAVGFAMREGTYKVAAEGALRLIAMLDKDDSVMKGFRPRVYQMLALCHEKLGTAAFLRPQLVRAYGLASVKHDSQSQAVLLNLLLRNYIKAGLIEAAEKFIKNANAVEKMADSAISVNQQARFLYYWGKICAIQLDYHEAHVNLSQALRKAPQSTGRSFRIAIQQLSCIVQMLMGEVPSASTFEEDIQAPMKAYIAIMQAVRTGNLEIFTRAVSDNMETFRKDETLSLILRLRQSVLKTALRNISLSYSKIPFGDVKDKLSLGSVIGAEYVCAKSIGDGVIEAVLEHGSGGSGFMQSVAVSDVYATAEPLDALNQRIQFCLEIRNDAVKSMRYPSASAKGGLGVSYEDLDEEDFELEFDDEEEDMEEF